MVGSLEVVVGALEVVVGALEVVVGGLVVVVGGATVGVSALIRVKNLVLIFHSNKKFLMVKKI